MVLCLALIILMTLSLLVITETQIITSMQSLCHSWQRQQTFDKTIDEAINFLAKSDINGQCCQSKNLILYNDWHHHRWEKNQNCFLKFKEIEIKYSIIPSSLPCWYFTSQSLGMDQDAIQIPVTIYRYMMVVNDHAHMRVYVEFYTAKPDLKLDQCAQFKSHLKLGLLSSRRRYSIY